MEQNTQAGTPQEESQPRTDEASLPNPTFEPGEEVVIGPWVWKVIEHERGQATIKLALLRELVRCPKCSLPMAPENVERPALPPEPGFVQEGPPWVCSACDTGAPQESEPDPAGTSAPTSEYNPDAEGGDPDQAAPTQPPAPDTATEGGGPTPTE